MKRFKVPHFQDVDSEKIKLISQKGVNARRSPELQKAWADQKKLQKAYKDGEGKSGKELARKYHINERSMFRILRGK